MRNDGRKEQRNGKTGNKKVHVERKSNNLLQSTNYSYLQFGVDLGKKEERHTHNRGTNAQSYCRPFDFNSRGS